MVGLFIVPTLRSIALNTISVKLCSRERFLSTIPVNPDVNNQSMTNRMMKEWYSRNTPSIVHDVEEFLIPVTLKGELVDVFAKTAFQIHYWKSVNQRENVMRPFLLHHFDLVSWNPFGEIDEVGTAENVIQFNSRNQSLPPAFLYHIACYYSFQKLIYDLLSLAVRQGGSLLSSMYEKYLFCDISLYWVYRHTLGQSRSVFEHLFLQAVSLNNLSAMQYFLKKLPFEGNDVLFHAFKERAANTIIKYPSMKHEASVDVFVFLLSNMTENQQKEIFSTYSCFILTVFLTSAQKISFPYILDLLFKFLSSGDVYHLLIQTAATHDKKSFSYEDIFIKIFEKCSARKKQKIIQKIVRPNYTLLRYLRTRNKIRCIQFLLIFASTKQRQKIEMIVKGGFCEVLKYFT